MNTLQRSIEQQRKLKAVASAVPLCPRCEKPMVSVQLVNAPGFFCTVHKVTLPVKNDV